MDTNRRMQDHELRLFPASQTQIRFGYARHDETGPQLSTEQGQWRFHQRPFLVPQRAPRLE